MHDLTTIKKMNAEPKRYTLIDKKCIVIMPDGEYLATVIGIHGDNQTVDIKLNDHEFVLTVYLGPALNRFKDADARGELAEFCVR